MRWLPALLGLFVVVRPGVARAEETPRSSVPLELLASVGATAVASPLVLTGARAVGTATPDLATSALPAVVLALALPPAIATGALFLERRREGVGTRLVPTYLVGLGAQVLVFAGAVVARTWVADTRELVVLSAVQGVVVGSSTTLAAELTF